MRYRFTIAVVATALLTGASAKAAELPSFESMGLPITAHQVAVLGSAHVQERAPVATLTMEGMPASPHQIAILTPRTMRAVSKAAIADIDGNTVATR